MQSSKSSAHRGATQPVRLVQARRFNGQAFELVVEVEGVTVEVPHLNHIQIHPQAARLAVGRFKPVRRYSFEIKPGYALTISGTPNGVAVALTGSGDPDEAWHWCTRRVVVWWPWWDDVSACTWGGEAPEVAA
jgi:hypothetical protein